MAFPAPSGREENLYAHLTRVKRGPIRVDADELTYTLHIQLRYELENQLLSGELAVRNLRDAWNSSMEQRLGVKPASDLEGVLQDVHWAVGSFGYFPSYALGAVMAAQFYEALRDAVPDIDAQIARGEFGGPHGLAARKRARAGRARHRTGVAQALHRQAAVGHGRAALPRIEISRAANR